MIKVDKNITLPKPFRPGKPPIYPWEDMEIGDSFVAPSKVKSSVVAANRRHSPMKFTCRDMGDGKFRVWRIE